MRNNYNFFSRPKGPAVLDGKAWVGYQIVQPLIRGGSGQVRPLGSTPANSCYMQNKGCGIIGLVHDYDKFKVTGCDIEHESLSGLFVSLEDLSLSR
jgi:hypothetical protein